MEEKKADALEMAKKENEKGKEKEKSPGTIMKDKITKERLEKYFDVTSRALKEIKLKQNPNLNPDNIANDFLDMAKRYYEDAKHFKEKGDIVTAFAALNYAHGFLDAGARMKLFDFKTEGLFAADK